jgi:hypothetical protein
MFCVKLESDLWWMPSMRWAVILELCDTVTLLPLVILYLEPHYMTPESTERSVLNQYFLVRICH